MKISVSERDFSSQVEDLLGYFGWRWTHFRPAWSNKGYRTPIKGVKGFVDIVAVRRGLCLFIELKSEKGRLSPPQEEWARELKLVARNSLGVMYFLWTPSDWEMIVSTLC